MKELKEKLMQEICFSEAEKCVLNRLDLSKPINYLEIRDAIKQLNLDINPHYFELKLKTALEKLNER